MKKKQIRTAVIAVLVLLFAVTAILRIEIEPADPVAGAPSPVVSPEKPVASQPEATPDAAPGTPSAEVSPCVTGEEPDGENVSQTKAPAETDPDPTPETTPTPTAAATPENTAMPEPVPTPVETPAPEVPPDPVESAGPICTLEIRCDTVVDTSKLENPAVAPYVPADGVILASTQFAFSPGESVFDVLLRATRSMGIHMEFRDDSLYSGKYIEGINYLYEMDGGPLSGWMYKVNGQFPNYGCAAYTVEPGDAIVWMYTCDLGLDVGDNSTW